MQVCPSLHSSDAGCRHFMTIITHSNKQLKYEALQLERLKVGQEITDSSVWR